MPRAVCDGGVVCFADGVPWVVGLGRLEYLVWVPVGPPSGVGGGVAAGCGEVAVSGAVCVVGLVTPAGGVCCVCLLIVAGFWCV